MKTHIIKLGVVGVDSGQLVICDPSYISSQFKETDSEGDHAHRIFRHTEDGSLWQYTYGEKSQVAGVTPFPGNYGETIPEYMKTPNQLIEAGLFIETDIDPTPHIPGGEFSYRGICKATKQNDHCGGQLNYTLGHAGAAVACSTGMGDGVYEVMAEVVDTPQMGRRVKKIWVEFISDKEAQEMDTLHKIANN